MLNCQQESKLDPLVCRNWFRQLLIWKQREEAATSFHHFHINLRDFLLSISPSIYLPLLHFSSLSLWQSLSSWTEDETASWCWPTLHHSSKGWCARCPLFQSGTNIVLHLGLWWLCKLMRISADFNSQQVSGVKKKTPPDIHCKNILILFPKNGWYWLLFSYKG